MWASALGRASNLVSKLSEIVAPIEDDNEEEDTRGNEYGGGMFGMDGFLSGPLEDTTAEPEPISVLPESPGANLVDINLDENRSIVPIVQLPKSTDPIITSTLKPLTSSTTTTSLASSSSSSNERIPSTNNQRLNEEDMMRKSMIPPSQPQRPQASSSSSSSTTSTLQVDLQKKVISMETENKMLLQQLAQKNALLVSMESTIAKNQEASSSSIPSVVNQPPTMQSPQPEIETATAIAEWKTRIQQLESQLREEKIKHTQAQEKFRTEKEQLLQQFDEKEKTWQMQITESNVRLQECEESAWQARAEASELLHAYEHEKHSNEVLQVKLGQVEGTLAMLERVERGREKESDSSTATTTAGSGVGMLTTANKIETITAMETVSLDDSTAATVGSTNGMIISQDMEKKEKEKKELLQQVETLGQQRKDLETALTQSKKETEQIRVQFQDQQHQQQTMITQLQQQSTQQGQQNSSQHALLTQQLQQSESQVVGLRQQIVKVETESKQLHQVIAQLRQVRRDTKEEGDGVLAERDELRQKVSSLTYELADANQRALISQGSSEALVSLRADHEMILQRLRHTESLLDDCKGNLARSEQTLYELETQQEVGRADALLMQQDLATTRIELTNLHQALQSLQRERTVQGKRQAELLQASAEEAQKQTILAVEAAEKVWKEQLIDMQERLVVSEQRCQDEALFRRKAEIDLNAEKRQMQKTLNDALAQLKNSQDDVVDRALTANLICSYLQRRRPRDILDLISKVLAFSDDQLVAVGLKVPPTDPISSLLSSVIGKPEKGSDSDLQTKQSQEGDSAGGNLAELWLNFLLLESSEEDHNEASSSSSATASSSSSLASSSSSAGISTIPTATSSSSIDGTQGKTTSNSNSGSSSSNIGGSSNSSGSVNRILIPLPPSPFSPIPYPR